MSYTKTISRRIRLPYSGRVNYPASEHGGTEYYSGEVEETINIDIEINTDPFDESIKECRSDVNKLTGAIVATETAQVASIHSNSRKVGKTIIEGFFKTVRSDLSQQISELRSKIESSLLFLNKMADRVKEKQTQLANDYRRLTERYSSLFNDLNKELENRIYSLDAPAFKFKDTGENVLATATGEHSGSVAAVTGLESAEAIGRIAAARVKRKALEANGRAHSFLRIQKSVDRLISRCLLPESETGMWSAPLIIFSAKEDDGQQHTSMHTSPVLPNNSLKSVKDRTSDLAWSQPITTDDAERIRAYFNSEVAAKFNDRSDLRSERVRATMLSLFSLDGTTMPS